ncbi:MAG: D-2-hydroxyacid dehydrogenase [Clostridiales bacterium]|jgi:glycerate dehydrogenase|nr:D-2-hydroxyacid dehydrogenase [Clostridiales bacterium]
MNIVILDAFTTNPGDLDWKRLEALGNLTVYDKTEERDIVPRAGEAELVLTNKTPLSAQILKKLPKCRYIGTLSTGYNVIDLTAARDLGIPVCNVPAYCTKAVAQMTFALLFALTNQVELHNRSVHDGQWCESPHFCYWNSPLVELEHKTMGIVGYGAIGQSVAQMALALGMKVLIHSRTRRALPQGCEWVELEQLFQQSDVVSIHCPLTDQTENLINRDTLAMMKPNALLINTSRGPVIQEEALAHALNQGIIAGAALDVLSKEPPSKDNPLLTAKNCVITPHIAWAAKDSRKRLIETVADNVEAFLRGRPQNVVNECYGC